MAKKKEPSTPLPQSLASFHNATFDHLQSKNSSQSNSATIVEGDEMVTPGPSIVHPSAGPISRKELKNRIGLVMFQGIQEKSNGTVPTSSAKGSGSGSKSSSPPVVEVSLPVSDDWSDLFKGKWNAQGMKLGFVPPVVPPTSQAIIPVVTPVQSSPQVNSDDDGGWRVFTKKTKDKGKRPVLPAVDQSNAYMSLIEEESSDEDDDQVEERNEGQDKENPPTTHMILLTWNIRGLVLGLIK